MQVIPPHKTLMFVITCRILITATLITDELGKTSLKKKNPPCSVIITRQIVISIQQFSHCVLRFGYDKLNTATA